MGNVKEEMGEFRDWKITLPFSVPPGDFGGLITEALFEAAQSHAPAEAAGLVVSANAVDGKATVIFTLISSSRELADEIGQEMSQRIREAVFSGDDAYVSAA